MSVLSGMPRSRKSRAKRRGRPSTSSRSPQRGSYKLMAQHTKGWNANQAPVAPSTGALTRQAMDLDVKGGLVIVQLRVAPQAVSASEKHPQKNRRRMSLTNRDYCESRRRSLLDIVHRLSRGVLLTTRPAKAAIVLVAGRVRWIITTIMRGIGVLMVIIARFWLAGLGHSIGSPARTRHSCNSTRRQSSRRTRSLRWSRPRCYLRRPINARREHARAVSTFRSRTSAHMQRLPIGQMRPEA